MDARASAKYLRGSPQKARLVVDMIRGKNVNEALAVLQYTNKRAADGIEKCLRSAVANATEAAEKANIAVDPDDLWVKAAFIDMGPTKNRRRMRPAPQGRAYKERRHFHHVTLLLSSDEEEGVKGKRTSKAGKPKTSKPGKKLAAKNAAAAPKAAAKRAPAKQPETAATASETPDAATTTTTSATETATENS
ncbi:MAG TPA: 50S ribosomal protein L22 [Pyrinomonadaceae bacterium]|nr:50S ribosomal protein L22 [Pyrinomonadaceae bacterium]